VHLHLSSPQCLTAENTTLVQDESLFWGATQPGRPADVIAADRAKHAAEKAALLDDGGSSQSGFLSKRFASRDQKNGASRNEDDSRVVVAAGRERPKGPSASGLPHHVVVEVPR
jgi:hypothetical protein